jgi:tRNA(fMet)-specific endonuclease VapC
VFLLDTNIISDLVRNPAGGAARRLASAGETNVAMSVVVAGELLYGAKKKGSARLTERVEAFLSEIEVLPLAREAADLYG